MHNESPAPAHTGHDTGTTPVPTPASGPAPSRFRLLRLLLAAVALVALAAPDAGAVAGPLESRKAMADPSVARTGPHQYVAVATGPRVTRLVSRDGVRWRRIGPALARRPVWARPGSGMWASDVARVGDRWLLYFAAPVRGMGRTSRCIGVASSRTATGRFRPVSRRPLVCPPAAHAPRAEDRIIDRRRSRPTYPTIGVIDPSLFVDHGRAFLLYKTDGKPSSVRLLRLTRNGMHARGRSRSLLAARGVVENPVMVRHGRWLYLLMSQGDYTRCSYSTVWRRSRSILHWRNRPQRTLLARHSTGLCGPGGADVVAGQRAVRVYFHAWMCRRAGRPCVEPFQMGRRVLDRRPVRALYGARLRFSRGALKLASFIGPRPRHAAHGRGHGRHHGKQGGRHHEKPHVKHRKGQRHRTHTSHHRAHGRHVHVHRRR